MTNRALDPAPAAHLAHDLRGLLATIGLHLETLERLAGSAGAKAADAAHALAEKAATLCNTTLDSAAGAPGRGRRRGVDILQTIRCVADLVAPSVPDGFILDIPNDTACTILADPNDLFRILFNLVSNAVAVGRKTGLLHRVAISVTRHGSTASVRIRDDGPGLPGHVLAGLFKPRSEPSPPRHGYGLSIARELAERNGGTLTLTSSAAGTEFVVTLPSFAATVVEDRPAAQPPEQRAAG